MDKEKIINQLQQKIDKKYLNTKIEDCYNMLALEFEGEVIAWFSDWDPDEYIMDCGPKLTEWALSNSILLNFYKEGRKLLKKKLLKKPIKKYRIKVLKGKSAERCSRYLNVNYRANIVTFASDIEFEDWRASFTKKEIEELKKRDDIAIDWDKVRLEEVE